MIEIKPCQNTDELKNIFKISDIDENTFVMCAKDKEEILGIGIIKLYVNYAVFSDIIFKDEMLGLDYSMGKAMLNFIERRSIFETYANNNVDESLLKRLRFAKNDNKMVKEFEFFVNLEGYFNVNC